MTAAIHHIETTMMRVPEFRPLPAFLRTLVNLLLGRIHLHRRTRGRRVLMDDGSRFTVFRHVSVDGKPAEHSSTAVFRVRFRLARMSAGRNKIFSLVPIPVLIGLPGFRAKCWMLDESSNTFQGIYEWRTADHARAYSHSFAMGFMKRRSVPGSLSYDILPGRGLVEYLDSLEANR